MSRSPRLRTGRSPQRRVHPPRSRHVRASSVFLDYGDVDDAVAPAAIARVNPAPTAATGGMLMGSRPPIGAAPTSARAAARCDTGAPLHAMRYAGTSLTCCNKYGLPSDTTTGCAPRATSSFTNCTNPCGADKSDTVEPAARYELTTTTSAESATVSNRQ